MLSPPPFEVLPTKFNISWLARGLFSAMGVWRWGRRGRLWLRTPALGVVFSTLHTLSLCPSKEEDLLGPCLQLCCKAQGEEGRAPSGTHPVAYPSQAILKQGKGSPTLRCCHGRALCRGDAKGQTLVARAGRVSAGLGECHMPGLEAQG